MKLDLRSIVILPNRCVFRQYIHFQSGTSSNSINFIEWIYRARYRARNCFFSEPTITQKCKTVSKMPVASSDLATASKIWSSFLISALIQHKLIKHVPNILHESPRWSPLAKTLLAPYKRAMKCWKSDESWLWTLVTCLLCKRYKLVLLQRTSL